MFSSPATLRVLPLFVGLCLINSWVYAQLLSEDLPENAREINIEDKVGEFIPLDLLFNDERGNRVGLGKFFGKGKPVVLTLNYSDCPGLCIAQLDNLVATLRELNGDELGNEFEIITVSIDPSETPEKAARTKSKYLGLLTSPSAEASWHFLTGKSAEIAKLADAVGFRYSYDRVNKRYNHAAATYFVSSEGRLCRYLLSLGVEPTQFKFAVAEANEGKLSLSLADAVIQFCYLYDPDSNRYSADARRMMAFGGAAFSILLLGCTAPFWFARRGKSDADQGAAKEPIEPSVQDEVSSVAYNDSTKTLSSHTGSSE